jgi:hypothetical protein
MRMPLHCFLHTNFIFLILTFFACVLLSHFYVMNASFWRFRDYVISGERQFILLVFCVSTGLLLNCDILLVLYFLILHSRVVPTDLWCLWFISWRCQYLDYKPSRARMISNQWIGMDLEGLIRSLIQVLVLFRYTPGGTEKITRTVSVHT